MAICLALFWVGQMAAQDLSNLYEELRLTVVTIQTVEYRVVNAELQQPDVLVQRVAAHSFAKKAGLQGGFFEAEILGQKLWLGGDIIMKIQGISCDSPHHFNNIKEQVENLIPGQALLMEVLRQGKVVTLRAGS